MVVLKRDLTTGMVAKLLDVAPRTVSKWVDMGMIQGVWRIPGSRDRRIPRRSLAVFCQDRGIPKPPGLCPSVLLVCADRLKGAIATCLPDVEMASCASSFDAGFVMASTGPCVVVIDMATAGTEESRQIARAASQRGCSTIALIPEDRNPADEKDFSVAVSATTGDEIIARCVARLCSGQPLG